MQHTFVGFGQGELSLARGTLLAVSQRVNTDPQVHSHALEYVLLVHFSLIQ